MNFYYPSHLSLLYREGLDAHDLEPFEIIPGDMVKLIDEICYGISMKNKKIVGIVVCTGQPHATLTNKFTNEPDFFPDVQNKILGVIWAGIVE